MLIQQIKTTFYLQIIIYSQFLLVTVWEPPIDYCKEKCKDTKIKKDTLHVACICFIYKGIDECDDDVVAFRRKILEVHNKYRNQIANGDEEQKGYPSAANMMALNYDLELEYIARCYGGDFNNDKQNDKCQEPKGFPVAGQNLGGTSSEEILRKNPETLAIGWYKQLDAVKENRPEFISHYKRDQTKEKFSQFVWATHRSVGCARIFNEYAKSVDWKNILLCQYAGAVRVEDGPNVEGKPVYETGTPCSACPDTTKCNNEYPNGQYGALCGEIRPVPTDKPYWIGNRKISEEDDEPGVNGLMKTEHESTHHKHRPPSRDEEPGYQYLNTTKLNDPKNSTKSCKDKNMLLILFLPAALVVIGCSI